MKNLSPTSKTLYLGFLIGLTTLLIPSCVNAPDPLVKSLVAQRDSLLQSAGEKDTAIRQLTSSFNEIETNLGEVTKKQNSLLIHIQENEDIADKRGEINQSIAEINELMLSNSKKIRSLSAQMNRVKYQNLTLNRMVDLLFEHIMHKNNDLADLNQVLRQKNKSIAALNNLALSLNDYAKENEGTIQEEQQELDMKDLQLNAAYYVLGGPDDLKHMCILDHNNKLMGGFNQAYFKQIDVRKENLIPGDRQAKNDIVKLLTPHPAASYEFIRNDQGKKVNIKITNQVDFWSRSKYLVVETR